MFVSRVSLVVRSLSSRRLDAERRLRVRRIHLRGRERDLHLNFLVACSSHLPFLIECLLIRKIGARLVKEAAYYESEVKENEAKIEQMKDENRGKHDIKYFQEVLSESHMMIPDSTNRRDKALVDLLEFVALLKKEEEGNADLMGCEWMDEARKILVASGFDNEEGGCGDDRGDVALTSVDGLEEGEEF